MASKKIEALVSNCGDDPQTKLLGSPAVGYFRPELPEGAGVVPGQQIGQITILGHSYPLMAPRHAIGVVTEVYFEEGSHAVDYSRPLFKLGPAHQSAMKGQRTGPEDAAGIAEEMITVKSPSNGVFYRRPDPQSPPYVSAGDEVEIGQALGLVEVMKCFNQIRYTGAGLPKRAKVVQVMVDDSDEIQLNQVLFVLEPMG